MSEDTLRVEAGAAVATITINRPKSMNALNDATLLGLRRALAECADAGGSVIVLAGEGTRAFSAGSDIKELASQALPERIAHTDLGQSVADALEASPCAVIAAVEGYCLGGGLELALACDLCIVGSGATLGLPEVEINALPSWGGTYRLPRAVGVGRAKQITLFGRRLDAAEAVEWGLAYEAVDEGAALQRAVEIAEKLAGGASRETITRAKRLLDSFGVDARTARRLELLTDSAQLGSAGFESSFGSFGS